MGAWGLATGNTFITTPSRAPEKPFLEHRIQIGVFIRLFEGQITPKNLVHLTKKSVKISIDIRKISVNLKKSGHLLWNEYILEYSRIHRYHRCPAQGMQLPCKLLFLICWGYHTPNNLPRIYPLQLHRNQ